MSPNLLSVRALSVRYRLGQTGWFGGPRWVQAVDGVSFDLAEGEVLGLVGESGSGKSSLGRALIGLVPIAGGDLIWRGAERDRQIIFQDPLAALNPRMTVAALIGEPLALHAPQLSQAERRDRIIAVLERVGLSANMLGRYPHEFSGGQCQRLGIARALVLHPRLIICDEPVSALDVSIQAQIINLLLTLQREDGLALLFISHNLAVVRRLSQRVLVLYQGQALELADVETLYAAPRHPYTEALLAAIPNPDPASRQKTSHKLIAADGQPVLAAAGCAYAARCPKVMAQCRSIAPKLTQISPDHWVKCHLWSD